MSSFANSDESARVQLYEILRKKGISGKEVVYKTDKKMVNRTSRYTSQVTIPSIFGDEAFIGVECKDRKKAEKSAAEALLSDPGAQIILENIAPIVNTNSWASYPEDMPAEGMYEGIGFDRVVQVTDEGVLRQVQRALEGHTVLGFDTESRPQRIAGAENTGPHLVQLATSENVYLFPILDNRDRVGVPRVQLDMKIVAYIGSLLQSTAVLKVGFGLSNDIHLLRNKLDCQLQHFVDLASAMKAGEVSLEGITTLSIVRGIKLMFNRTFTKSKKHTMSNWSRPLHMMSREELLYAANDAHGALVLYTEWQARREAQRREAERQREVEEYFIEKNANVNKLVLEALSAEALRARGISEKWADF